MINEYKITKLGEGGFGVVYKGKLGSRDVAVKVLKPNNAPTQFINEINVFLEISHNNLVSLLGYCNEGSKFALIYEFMDNNDLSKLLSTTPNCLSWTDRLKIAIDTAEGLYYLHRKCKVPIVHRDLKPANILLNQKLQAKVGDFGLSKIFPGKEVTSVETKVVVTPRYTAPEYLATGKLNEKVDVYSFGVVLKELLMGVNGTNEQPMQVPDRGSVLKATNLVKLCVEIDQPTKRPDMWEILVVLKDCLNMEVNKNEASSSSGSTSTGIRSLMTPGNATM